MNKQVADELKQKLAADHEYEDAFELLGEEQTVLALARLDAATAVLESDISSWCLDHEHDLLDTEEKTLCRVYWFSKGMEDTFVCINPRFQIKGFDSDIPLLLLSQVAEHLDKLQTMLTGEGEREIKKWRTDGR